MMVRFAVAAAMACLTLAACVSEQNWGAVESAVAEFHDRQARSEDAAIYEDAAQGLRSAATLETLTRINAAVRAIEGCSAPTRDQMNWRSNQTTSGHFVTVAYNRQCTHGDLVETFGFQIVGGAAKLLSYNAAGMALFPPATPTPPSAAAPAEQISPTEPAATATPEAPAN